MISKLPSLSTICPSMVEELGIDLGYRKFGKVSFASLIGSEIEVVVKKSMGYAQISEAMVFQTLSGHPNFLLFFGIMGNSIVIEAIKIFSPVSGVFVSSTLMYAFTNRLNDIRFDWQKIAEGIVTGTIHMHKMKILHNDLKENNILLKDVRGAMIPKICDFGKACMISEGLVSNLTVEEKKVYNDKHRHIAYELRNSSGYKQLTATDAFSVVV